MDPLVKTLRNSPAKLEVVRDAEQSSGMRFAAEWGVMIASFRQLGAIGAKEKRKLKNVSFGTHSPIEIHQA
jgi:hypothetical protein